MPSDLPDGSQLICRLRNRDREVMGELYDRYGKISYLLIFRIVGERCLAEDLVQETFLRVWTRSQLYRPERGGLGSWIMAIARNQAFDYLQSSQGRMQGDRKSTRLNSSHRH